MRFELKGLLLGMLLPLLFPSGLPAQSFAYVTNTSSNSVSVIDTSSDTVAATIPVGGYAFGVAITPDGTRAYVSGGALVSVIDIPSNTVVATVTVPAGAGALAFNPDGTRAYVCGGNLISVIDTSTNTVVAMVRVGEQPRGVAITPDGTRAYVANFSSRSVSVIDTSSNAVIATVAVGSVPFSVAITPDGTRAYVTIGAFFPGSVSVIDTSTNAVAATIAVGGYPFGVAITPDGTRAYVTDEAGGFSVIDTSTNTVVDRGGAGEGPVAITPDGTRAYIPIFPFDSNQVDVIDTSTNAVLTVVTVGNNPLGVAITPAVAFSAFSAKLDILAAKRATPAGFDLKGAFTLAARGTAIDPLTQPLILLVGSYGVTVPAGSFHARPHGTFTYDGTIRGVTLDVRLVPTGADACQIQVHASRVNLREPANSVVVKLGIGNTAGTTSVTPDLH